MERRDVVAAHSLSGREPRVMDLDYVMPLRWEDDAGLAELTAYLRWLSGHARVIVVDGSPPRLFAGHAGAWRGLVRHLPPEGDTANGKVAAVVTGLCEARGEQVVIADDVRHDLRSLARITALLETADPVRPQNHFFPLPWHAWWDTPAPC